MDYRAVQYSGLYESNIDMVGVYEQSWVKTLLLSFDNHAQNVPLPTPKLRYGTIFQPAIPETLQKCFYTTLYIINPCP